MESMACWGMLLSGDNYGYVYYVMYIHCVKLVVSMWFATLKPIMGCSNLIGLHGASVGL